MLPSAAYSSHAMRFAPAPGMALLVNAGTTRPAITATTNSTTSRPSASPVPGYAWNSRLQPPSASTSTMKNQLRLRLAMIGTPIPAATPIANSMSTMLEIRSEWKASTRAMTQSAAIAASTPPVGVGRPVQARTAVRRKPAITANA